MDALLGALIVFTLRICDVSIGTMRVMFTVRGSRLPAMTLGFLEATIWLLAVRQIFDHLDNWWNILGYGGGFAMGTFVGITIEQWIAPGWVILRVISREHSADIRQRLHDNNFGVTSVHGEGRSGKYDILFVVASRRRANVAMEHIRQVDEEAFVTVNPVTPARGGYLPHVAPTGVRK